MLILYLIEHNTIESLNLTLKWLKRLFDWNYIADGNHVNDYSVS